MLPELQKFWMNYGAVIVAVSAAVTLIGVVFNLLKSSGISDKAVDRTAQAEQSLSTEHRALSAEHRTASAEHSVLLDRANDSKTMLSGIQSSLSSVERRVMETENEHKLNFASLSEAQRGLTRSADDIGKFAREFERIGAENQSLLQKVQQLEQANLRQEQQNGQLSREVRHLKGHDRGREWEP